ncbi:putative 2OG-Fe(II) oxygenase [Asticcacaulis sp.]|uniref:putative 2OG-Fe(II) oxygenase n=1 Tax=Asticcacaulis sp. TaxID=1872648 RepID=UPI0026106EAC|nr:putative 2OG-Fe(II) oxygenase [Asticcacaulis sp.]
MGPDYKMQSVAPFSPAIIKARAPEGVVDALNEKIDALLMEERERQTRDWSEFLAGNLKTEMRITDIIRSTPALTDLLFDVARTYTYKCHNALLHYGNYEEATELKDKKIEIRISEGWINDMIAGDFNPVHFHQGSTYSCVLFLRNPEGYEQEFQADKARQHSVGCLQFIDSRTAIGVQNLFTVKPVVGDFYLWPSWMLHTVYPFRGEGIRRSMSANLSLV